jgi:hypothetical protein
VRCRGIGLRICEKTRERWYVHGLWTGLRMCENTCKRCCGTVLRILENMCVRCHGIGLRIHVRGIPCIREFLRIHVRCRWNGLRMCENTRERYTRYLRIFENTHERYTRYLRIF